MKKKTLTVRVSSGLGNQLFMFSNAYCISKLNNLNLKIDDKSAFFQKKNKSDNRLSKLRFFNIPKKYFSEVNVHDNLLKHLLRKVYIFINKFLNIKIYLSEHSFKNSKKTFFKNLKILDNKNYEIKGHFESEKYFIKKQSDLQRILTPNFFLNSKYINLLKNSNSISIHIRTRGYYGYAYKYYKKKKKIEVKDQINYINKSILYFNKKVNNPKYFIWSDDITKIKKFFKKSNFYFIYSGNDVKDFCLFYYCKHFIVSPSTYHWMGAWLNKNKDKICVRPKDMTPSNNIDFWPKNWIKI